MLNNKLATARLVTLTSQPLIAVSLIILIILSYLYVDIPLANYIHFNNVDEKSSLLHFFMQTITNIGSGGLNILAAFIVSIIALIIRSPRLRVFAVLWLLLLIVDSFVVEIIKVFLGRSRPMELFNFKHYGFYFMQLRPGMWSFPSGHVMIICTTMTAFSLRWPRYEILFVFIILIIALSRIILEQHYLSDVLGGLLLGTIIPTYLYRQVSAKTRWGSYL